MTIDEQMRCDRCGSTLSALHEGSTQGTYCQVCGASAVTTHISAIRLDRTRYSIHLAWQPSMQASPAQMQALARATGVNTVTARRLLRTNLPMVFEGVAEEVFRVRASLQSVGFNVEIDPGFDY